MRAPTMSIRLPVARFRTLRRSPALVAGALLAACNGSPRVCDDIPRQELFTGHNVLLELCFEDPEGETLTIAATSSDEPVATVQAYDLKVNIQAISPGNADVTATATDPGGRSASLDIEVLVPNQPPYVLIFRDDFDGDNREEWAFNFATHYLHGDGLLHLRSRYSYYFGVAKRTVNVAEWELRASVGVEGDAECKQVGLLSEHDRSFSRALFAEGSYEVHGPGDVGEVGSSDAVRVAGERTEMIWTSRSGVMTLAAGETVLARLDHQLFPPWSSPELMELAGLMTYAPCGDTDKYGLYDWADLWAIEAADEPLSRRSGLDVGPGGMIPEPRALALAGVRTTKRR